MRMAIHIRVGESNGLLCDSCFEAMHFNSITRTEGVSACVESLLDYRELNKKEEYIRNRIKTITTKTARKYQEAKSWVYLSLTEAKVVFYLLKTQVQYYLFFITL